MSGGESVGTKKREDTNLGSRKIESGPRRMGNSMIYVYEVLELKEDSRIQLI